MCGRSREVTSILMDGEPVPYQMLWEDGDRFRVAKIGDPDSYLTAGTHVFEIRYTIAGVLDPGDTGADKEFAGIRPATRRRRRTVFFWNVIAPAWNNSIDRADITVTLPGESPARSARSATASAGLRRPDGRGNTVTLSARPAWPPRTPVTVRAGVDVPTPPRAELPWSYKWDRVLGRSVTRRDVGRRRWRSPAASARCCWYRTTVETAAGFPLQYAPPPGLGPVQSEYIRTEAVPKNGLTATLFYLADRGLIDLRQVSDKQWNVRGIASPGAWADVDPVSVAVARR